MGIARVMTADEIRETPRAGVVWVEFFNAEEGKSTSLIPAMKCADGTLVDEDACVIDDYERDMKYNADGYWRYWNAKPTLRQREETPWE